MQDRLRHSQRIAALRAGFSERTARRAEADPRLPSQRKVTRRRTVPDPLAAVWEPVLLPILQNDPAVQAVTLLRHLRMTDPDAFGDDRVRRTLERRVREWRALHGTERDVIFRQVSEPGRMALSDFTDATELAVTIAGQPLAHRLYHFVLAYSGWEHVAVAALLNAVASEITEIHPRLAKPDATLPPASHGGASSCRNEAPDHAD